MGSEMCIRDSLISTLLILNYWQVSTLDPLNLPELIQMREQLAGHAIYTQPTWLPFHLRLVTESATLGPPSH